MGVRMVDLLTGSLDTLRYEPRICFFDERVDVIVDGEHRDRPLTPWTDE
jgi:hypothetical protein